MKNWAFGLRIKTGGRVREVEIDIEGSLILSVGRDGEARNWDRETRGLKHSYFGHYGEVLGVAVLAQMAVTVRLDKTIQRWPFKGGELEEATRRKKKALRRREVVNKG